MWLFVTPWATSPPGSSVHGRLQAGILEWVDIPFSEDLLNPQSNPGLLHYRQILYHLSHLNYIHVDNENRNKSVCVYIQYTQTHVHIIIQSLSYGQLCHPMNCSTPGFPLCHYLPKFAQTHFHWTDIFPEFIEIYGVSFLVTSFNYAKINRKKHVCIWVSCFWILKK